MAGLDATETEIELPQPKFEFANLEAVLKPISIAGKCLHYKVMFLAFCRRNHFFQNSLLHIFCSMKLKWGPDLRYYARGLEQRRLRRRLWPRPLSVWREKPTLSFPSPFCFPSLTVAKQTGLWFCVSLNSWIVDTFIEGS